MIGFPRIAASGRLPARRGGPVNARFALLSLVALPLSGCGMVKAGLHASDVQEAPAIAPGTPLEPVPDDAARAVLERYLPERADDPAFRALVDEALRSSRGREIARRGAQSAVELAEIRTQVIDRGLPDLFVGIPYWESYLEDDAVSRSCAGGAWQLMPETAVELGLAVSGCTIGGAVTWSPSPGSVASPESPYRGERCAMVCATDERSDLARATGAAIELLERTWHAPDVAASEDRAALVVLAYNTGLGNARARVAAAGDAFAGLERCASSGCTNLSKVAAEYVPGVVASAALATCGAATVPGSRFADLGRSGLCRALEAEGLLPEPMLVADVD